MRIALAHEWLTNWAGSERVAQQLAHVSCPTEFVTAVVDRELVAEYFPSVRVRSLWPSLLPGAGKHWARYALPMLAAWSTERIDADALVVSSHFAAHGATVRFDGPSIVYYHTPARLLWRPDLDLERLNPRLRAIVAALLPPLRWWDRHVASHPTVLLANSTAVARRISAAYGRTARVLHPPVDVSRWSGVERREPRHLLMLGRLVAYKQTAIGIEAARRSGLPLVIIGDGPERARLEADAPTNVRFIGHASHDVIRDAMAHAHALIFPGEEDFGIAAVEALAAGVPVVAYAAGGALDYVTDDVNGLHVASQDPDEFALAAKEAVSRSWDTEVIRRTASLYDIAAFRSGFAEVLSATLGTRWRR
ncbi:MAG TPA: glycosyltransferase [Acidothermaceae bacterium]|jgi:glycosyltransferase involved in cell wall biosynthesis|nr:glycosyltransferase [Acidothermaceae bacterium]